jgi:type VI secretion system secreted protein Hcp
MAVDSFLELGDIKGESLDSEFKDKIPVLAFSWGVSQSGTMHLGPGGGGGKAHVTDLSVTTYFEKSTPNVIQACCLGKHFPTATLTCRKAGGDAPVQYLKYDLEEVMVTSVNTGGSGGEDRFTVNLAINFAKFKVTYTPQKPDGTADPPVGPVGYDIAQNAKL